MGVHGYNDTRVYPLTFQQAIPPIYQEAAKIEDDGVKYAPRLQRDLTRFANDWMRTFSLSNSEPTRQLERRT
ncbi:MAG TPA: hypothetical protein DD473_05190 [Planctomycetaceae bacterium]|nr:hypothetical protein [Planctomycetaceae bacterium]